MTDKKLKVNSAAYTELSIQIAVLEAKLDKVLQLLVSPEVVTQPTVVNVDGSVDSGFYKRHWVDNGLPTQWPNESHTDYLKRIGQYNEAQSDDEEFLENYK